MSRAWMLRLSDGNRFKLVGPMDREEVLSGIREGKISLKDEACAANGYWFGFHESDELHRQLGVSWSQLRRETAESTRVDGLAGEVEEDTDEITDEITDVESARPARVRQLPSSGSLLSRVPGWFWLVLGAWALSALYGLFGSTK